MSLALNWVMNGVASVCEREREDKEATHTKRETSSSFSVIKAERKKMEEESVVECQEYTAEEMKQGQALIQAVIAGDLVKQTENDDMLCGEGQQPPPPSY